MTNLLLHVHWIQWFIRSWPISMKKKTKWEQTQYYFFWEFQYRTLLAYRLPSSQKNWFLSRCSECSSQTFEAILNSLPIQLINTKLTNLSTIIFRSYENCKLFLSSGWAVIMSFFQWMRTHTTFAHTIVLFPYTNFWIHRLSRMTCNRSHKLPLNMAHITHDRKKLDNYYP